MKYIRPVLVVLRFRIMYRIARQKNSGSLAVILLLGIMQVIGIEP